MIGLPGAVTAVCRAPAGGAFLFDPLGDFGEVAGIAEILVDAGEADVGDMVERLQAGHYCLADPR